jgi:hypothetical protein
MDEREYMEQTKERHRKKFGEEQGSFDVSQSSYTLATFNAGGRPLEKLGMCGGDDQL